MLGINKSKYLCSEAMLMFLNTHNLSHLILSAVFARSREKILKQYVTMQIIYTCGVAELKHY